MALFCFTLTLLVLNCLMFSAKSDAVTNDKLTLEDTGDKTFRNEDDSFDHENGTESTPSETNYPRTEEDSSPSPTRSDDYARNIVIEASYLTVYKVGAALGKYVMPTVIILGIPTNLMAFGVFLQPSARISSPFIYLATLAAVDSIHLVSNLALFITPNAQAVIHRLMSLWECKVLHYLSISSSASSNWVLVAMSVERMLVTRFPLQAKVWCTPRRARVACVLGCVAAFFWTMPSLYFAGINANDHSCFLYILGRKLDSIFFPATQAIAVFIPTIVMFVMNILIINKIEMRRKNPQSLQEVAAKSKSESRQSNATTILLLVSFTFIFCHLLLVGNFIVFSFLVNPMTSPTTFAAATLCLQLGNLLKKANHGANFWLYFVSGKRFRKDLVNIFCCIVCRQKAPPTQQNI